ncbi:hypothetical protein ACYULU_04010 [Breznakiellaceae bacterium SP9]
MRKWIIALIVLLALSAAALSFFLRAPIVVLGDAAFTALYGPARILEKQVAAALTAWRQVKAVTLAAAIDDDMIVFAIEEAVLETWSSEPHAVLAPFRYYDGARKYAQQYPQVPVLVFGGTAAAPEEIVPGKLLFLRTDVQADLQRAGALAADLSPETQKVLVFEDGQLSELERKALTDGLAAKGSKDEAVFLSAEADFEGTEAVSCAIILRYAETFLSRNTDMRCIIFSWIDPSGCPSNVVGIFDDSPWALLADALAASKKGQSRIPSQFIFP